MKLWVLLDELVDDKLLSEDDLILCNSDAIEKHYGTHKVFRVDNNLANENISLFEASKVVFGDAGEAVQSLKNPIYSRILKPIANIVLIIDKITGENEINELVLVGGGKYPFLTMRHGEGEGNKKMFRTSWMCSCLLYEKYKSSEAFTVSWINKKSALFLRLLSFVRETVFIIKIIIDQIKYTGSGRHVSGDFDETKPMIVTYTQKLLQKRHIDKLFDSIKDSFNVCNITGFNSADTPGDYIGSEGLSIKQIINLYCSCHGDLKKAEFGFDWNGIKISLRGGVLSRLGCSELLHVSSEIKKIDLTLKKYDLNAKYLVTDMTFGADLFLINRYCRANAVNHYNFQYVSMAKLMFPDLDLADRYYLLSTKVLEAYSAYSDKYHLYLPLNDRKKNVVSDDGLTVTIFLQPDWYAERYRAFLDEICRMIDDSHLKVTVNIKPHYRQNNEELFISISQKYAFCNYVEKSAGVNDLLHNSNFVMSMTSSVLLEAVWVGTPAFIIDIDGRDSDFISGNDITVEEVNFRCRSYEEITEYLKSAQNTVDKYEQRRQNYILSTQAITDIADVFE